MEFISNKFNNYKNIESGFINFFSKHKSIILPFIFILSYLCLYFLIDFSSQSLVAHDEGLYARRSRLVEDSYNWFSSPFPEPHHKTLGSYWFIALSIRLFGQSELALRLPSIISSLTCLFILYFITLNISNKKSAFISVVSLSSMPLWIQYSKYASPDIPFVLCILLVIMFFLKYLEANLDNRRYLYIFLSGLFISTSFFIRSYMVFVPLLGLTPFLLYHLFNSKRIFKIVFLTGLVFGFIPTLLNLYFSYKKFGLNGVTILFDFAKEKAVGGVDFTNFLLIPLNYIYLTFPIGLLLIILLVFTRSNYNYNYPLLIYWYPIISFILLLSMSTSYLHYYLFILPSLSILFSVKLESYSFRFSVSKHIVKFLLSLLVIFMTVSLVSLLFFYKDLLIDNSNRKILILYLSIILLVLSFLYSSRYIFDNRYSRFSLSGFFYSIVFPQYVSISLLYNFGVVGNPNFKLKSFLNDQDVLSIINNNTIYLYNVDSKINTLLRYYLPSAKIVKSTEDVFRYNYIITSDINKLYNQEGDSGFKLIDGFDNHFLMINKSK